jgi:hypothetical protein
MTWLAIRAKIKPEMDTFLLGSTVAPLTGTFAALPLRIKEQTLG